MAILLAVSLLTFDHRLGVLHTGKMGKMEVIKTPRLAMALAAFKDYVRFVACYLLMSLVG